MTNRLDHLTWNDVDQRREMSPLVIIPVGSCEQHGPALALCTDSERARAFAELLADRIAPLALVTPPVPVGVSEHHMGFTGTLTVNPVTFVQFVFEIIESLARHGWRRMFVLNGHGGNDAALGVLSTRIMRELPDICFAWSGISPLVADVSADHSTSVLRGHSCELETSQTMYLAPEIVRSDRLQAGTSERSQLTSQAALSRSRRAIHYPLPYDRVTPTGALGDARSANADLGKLLIETAADRLVPFLIEFANSEPAPPAASLSTRTDTAS
ncbi:MAG: creatininase family protein [Acidimicrobiales bacterium]